MTKLIGLTGAYDFLERMILEPAGARYNPDWKKARRIWKTLTMRIWIILDRTFREPSLRAPSSSNI